jgi:hypothetical protein
VRGPQGGLCEIFSYPLPTAWLHKLPVAPPTFSPHTSCVNFSGPHHSQRDQDACATHASCTFMLTIPRHLQGHSKSQSYSIMQTAHSTGFAVCNTTDKKEADAQSAELGNANLMSSVVEAN